MDVNNPAGTTPAPTPAVITTTTATTPASTTTLESIAAKLEQLDAKIAAAQPAAASAAAAAPATVSADTGANATAVPPVVAAPSVPAGGATNAPLDPGKMSPTELISRGLETRLNR